MAEVSKNDVMMRLDEILIDSNDDYEDDLLLDGTDETMLNEYLKSITESKA